MSFDRSGYSDGDCHNDWAWIRWRGAGASAIPGKRGQAFLRELLAALDALPQPRLIEGSLVREPGLVTEGGVCALGAVARARGMDTADLDADSDREEIAKAFGLPESLAAEIMYENDWLARITPEERFRRVREWVVKQIKVQP